MQSLGYRMFRTTERDFDGVPFAECRIGVPIYGLFEVYAHFPKSRTLFTRAPYKPVAIYDPYMERDPNPVEYFKKILIQMLKATDLPIEDVPAHWFRDENGCYTLENGECISDNCIHTRHVN